MQSFPCLKRFTGSGPEQLFIFTHIFIKGSATKLPQADEGVTHMLFGPVTLKPKYGVGHFCKHCLVGGYL